MTFIQRYYCKKITLCLSLAEKIAEAALLYVFKIVFPASLFCCTEVSTVPITISISGDSGGGRGKEVEGGGGWGRDGYG